MSQAMEVPSEGFTEEAAKDEIAFLGGTEKAPLYMSPMSASEAAVKIVGFTKTWADPFRPDFPYANPWATKKDNKGKKDRPAGPVRPGLVKGDVSL